MANPFTAIASGLVDLIYPPVCLVCGRDIPSSCLCAECIAEFRSIPPPFCTQCGEPVPAGSRLCERCEDGPQPAYAWSHAAFQYDGALLRAVHRLKYDRKPALARPLGLLLAADLDAAANLFDDAHNASLPAFDMLVPVPLHPSRLRRRGFNQAALLAGVVAEARGYKIARDAVERVKLTPTQTKMTLEQREANIRDAFRVTDPDLFDRKSVLIVDDVLTTTSTAREIARVIAEAGAIRICVLALARSV